MNRWRIVGLVLLAALAAWLVLRGCAPDKTVTQAPATTAPARDKFHASRPLRVIAVATPDQQQTPAELAWLERELRYLLMRGRMQVAPIDPAGTPTYTLRVEMRAAEATATARLLAPDGHLEREQIVQTGSTPLDTLQAFARSLPSFLGAVHPQDEWLGLLGTQDADAYAAFLESANDLLGPSGHGFTQPVIAENSASVDRLETLTRKHPRFARAWSLLAIAYLGLGGKDEESLARLAETTAERALSLDASLTNAESALGLVSLRSGEWVAAMDHFKTALQSDPNALPALEGLACLLADVGHPEDALPVARRAVTLQPDNVGANECLAYAQLAGGKSAADTQQSQALDVAAVRALDAILSGDIASAEQALRNVQGVENASSWVEPLLRAANDRRATPEALRAITRAANEGLIDPVTEVVCGAALRQSDFVLNRMLRLQKQGEGVPLRILWLPKTAFLRKHARFEDIVSAEGLLPFWQDHGLPDICAAESEVFGCKLKPQQKVKSDG